MASAALDRILMSIEKEGAEVDRSTSHLIGHIRSDPWLVIEWKACRNETIANAYIDLIDEAIFERDREEALQGAFTLRGLSRRINEHIACKAEACLGSAFCISGLSDLAFKQMNKALRLAGTCDDCLGTVNRRWGAILSDHCQYKEALKRLDKALMHFERINNNAEICLVLIARSGVFRFLDRSTEGMKSLSRALPLIEDGAPARRFVAAAVNAISLAAISDKRKEYGAALEIAEQLRSKIKGGRIHSSARGIIRWIRGLCFEKLCDTKNAIRCIESALSTFERRAMMPEAKVAMADLARIRRKGKQREVNDRHILRLIEATLRLDVDEEVEKILRRAKEDPSEQNILAWRDALHSYMPNLEPFPEEKAFV